MGVDYESFSTSLGEVTVTLTFEEVTSDKVLGLCHYYSSASAQTYGNAGWHQAYRTTGGSTVWNAEATGTLANAYGAGANAYYRVYKVLASYSLNADQAANVPTAHTISGKVAMKTGSHASFIFWTTTTQPNADGKTSLPDGDFNATAKNFVAIDLSTSWTTSGDRTQYSTSYFAVSCDGESVTSNADVSCTLQFTNVAVA